MKGDLRKPKICVVSLKYPPVYSGAGLQVSRLFQNLRKNNIDSFVITSDFNRSKRRESFDNMLIYKVKGNPGNWSTFSLVVFWVRLFRILYLKRASYNIIYIVSANLPLSIVGLFSKVLKKKSIVKITLANSDLADAGIGFWGNLQKNFLNYIDKYIAISKEIHNELIFHHFSSRNVLDLPNGVDTDLFYPLKEKDIRKESPSLLFVGVLDKRKGIDLLLEVWCNLKEKSDLRGQLIIVGPYSENNSTVSMYSKIEIEKNAIQFWGIRNNVHEIMKNSDVFILPSLKEGLPNVVLEAMASGLPVIVSNTSGAIDCVEHKINGIIFDIDDKEQLQNSIKLLMENHQMRNRMGEKSRKIIIDNFSMETVSNRYILLFKELLGPSKSQ